MKVYIPVYVLATIPVIMSFIISRSASSQFFIAVRIISNYLLGFYLYIGLFFLLLEIVLLIYRLIRKLRKDLPDKESRRISKRMMFNTSCIAIVLAFLMFLYSVINGMLIRTVSYDIKIDKDSPAHGLNIVLISDLHIGYFHGEKYLERVVDRVNSLNPDIILIAGDIFDGNLEVIKDRDAIIKNFSKFESKYGTYACLGNHDRRWADEIIGILSSARVRVLNDEFVNINDEFILIGRRDNGWGHNRRNNDNDDIENSHNRRMDMDYDGVNKDLPIIVIDHKPENYPEYPDFVDLILCGHTHRGQMIPINFITDIDHIEDYGCYRTNDTSPLMIVTSGVATWGPPLRSGSNNEVVNIRVSFGVD